METSGSIHTEELADAVVFQDAARVNKALAEGADVNGDVSHIYGKTILGLAAYRGDLEMVELLLSRGARVRDEDLFEVCEWETWDWKALSAEHERDFVRVLRLLLSHGANPNVRSGMVKRR